MTPRPDLLTLSIACPPPDEGVLEVRPIVNGRDFLAEVVPGGVGGSRYLGVGPRDLLDHNGPLHATAMPHEVRLAWSGCGVDECCGALYMTVTRDGDHVVWAGWRDLANQDFDLPELRFTTGQYEASGCHRSGRRFEFCRAETEKDLARRAFVHRAEALVVAAHVRHHLR
ncbi:hypothetical protein GCM10010309_50910 [Streptomyces violaceochromogenes]|nr:hypothetical protein GCM10010309_50910 [Streptomyces violaceochromogenes]